VATAVSRREGTGTPTVYSLRIWQSPLRVSDRSRAWPWPRRC